MHKQIKIKVRASHSEYSHQSTSQFLAGKVTCFSAQKQNGGHFGGKSGCITSRVRLEQWYRGRLRGERSGFDAQSRQPEIALGIIVTKRQEHRQQLIQSDLKLMGRVNRSLKQRVPVIPKNGPQKLFLKVYVSQTQNLLAISNY